MAETSYQTLEIFLIFRSGEGLTSFNKDNRKTMEHSGASIFGEYAKNLKVKFSTRSRSRL